MGGIKLKQGIYTIAENINILPSNLQDYLHNKYNENDKWFIAWQMIIYKMRGI